MRRVVSIIVTVVALLLLAGCKADALLEVKVDEDGGGVVYAAVALDQDAAARTVLYETKAGRALPVEDLVAAGWTVTGPIQEQDGRVWIRAEKPFSQADQLTSVVNEVAGADGAFRNFVVERSSAFGEKHWRFSGTVDLSKGLAGFSDAAVSEALGGEPLGQPAAAYAQQLGSPLEQLVSVTVVVDLPGELGDHNGTVGSAGQTVTMAGAPPTVASSSPGSTPAGSDLTAPAASGRATAVVWNPSFADDAPTALVAASSTTQLLPRLWRWIGLGAGLLGLTVLVWRFGLLFVDRWRDRRRFDAPAPARTAGRVAADPDADGAESVAVRSGPAPVVAGAVASAVAPAPIAPQPIGPVPAAVVAPATVAPPSGTPGDPVRPPVSSAAAARSDGGLGLIAIEANGALLSSIDPCEDVLVPFCRTLGSERSDRQIADLYRARVLGKRNATAFWAELGVSGDPLLLDDAYTRRFDLSTHVVSFLDKARRRGVFVVVVGDGAPEWNLKFRERFALDGLVGAWISSAELGVRVPHPDFFEALRRISDVPSARATVIAANGALLDTAERLGFRTVQYNPGPDDPHSEHAVLRSFADGGRSTPSAPKG